MAEPTSDFRGTTMITLPAISLTAPWCWLCPAGIKTLETRKGALLSGFSGPLVICRTKAPPAPYDLSRFGVTLPTLPYTEDDRGMAVGIVLVDRTWRIGVLDGTDEHKEVELKRRACYHDLDNRYLSDLTQCAWFPHPIEAKGSQTRFKVEVPRDYVPVWARPTSASSSETSK